MALAAGSDSFSLTPSSASYKINQTFTVTVKSNGSDPYNTVNAVINYDKSKLQFVSTDMSGDFDFPVNNSNGNGTVTLTAGLLNANPTGDATTFTGTHTVGTVTFKALAGSGSASLTLGSGSKIWQPTNSSSPPYVVNVWNGNTKAATYSLTGGSTNTNTNSNTSSTNKNTSTSTNKSKTGSTTKKSSKTANNESTGSTEKSPTGYIVAVKVTGTSAKSLQASDVTIDGQPANYYSQTDSTASFVGIVAGTHTVDVNADGKKTSKEITVVPGPAATVQQFNIDLGSSTSAALKPALTALIALLLIALLIGGGKGLSRKIKQHNDLSRHFPSVAPNDTKATTGNIPVKEATVSSMTAKPGKTDNPMSKTVEPTTKVDNLNNGSRSWNDQKAHNG